MKTIRTAVTALAVLALGVVICPRMPSRSQVDPHVLLSRVMQAEGTAAYSALQRRQWTYCGKTTRRTVRICRTPRPVPPDLAVLIRRNYEPLVEGEDTLAGRQAWTLRLKPRCKSFPWKQLWVDKQTGVVLASRDWSSRNEVKSSMKTISITYDTAPPRRSAAVRPIPPAGRDARSDLDRAFRAFGWKPLQPHYLPKGFKLLGVEVERKHRTIQTVYSDGLHAISVFVCPSVSNSLSEQPGDWGQGLVTIRQVDSRRVVVVADLSVVEIERIADSIGR